MASFNRVVLAGNVTRDITLRYTPGGTAVTDLGIAITRKYKQDNQTKEETTFVDVTLWGRTAEIAGEYLAKGRPVLIEGRLSLDQWTDESGQKRQRLKVVGENLQLLGGNQGSGGQQRQQTQSTETSYGGPAELEDGFYDSDDVPF